MRIAALLLTAFVIAGCNPVQGSGSFTLRWEMPTENLDGSPYDDPGGFNVYELSCPGTLDPGVLAESSADGAQITLDATCSEAWERNLIASTEPTELTFAGNASPGWHYWGVTAFDTSGNESGLSNVGGKNVLDQLFPRPPILTVE